MIIENNEINKSLILFELSDKLEFLTNLYDLKKIPKVLMLSGQKGIGKSTLINHFMNIVYDKTNYDFKEKKIDKNSSFYKQFSNNAFSNIIYLSGDNFKSVKIDDVRILKSNLSKSTISNKERFIILDDIEIFNNSTLNGLLKIIEEPSPSNYFILINNKTQSLIETIYSRAVEIRMNLSDDKRINIISKLIDLNQVNAVIDYTKYNITPGNFLSFNEILLKNNLDINSDLLLNIDKVLNLYKNKKEKKLINIIYFLINCHFDRLGKNNNNIETICNNRSFLIDNINRFFTYNINKNSLMNCINNKIYNG